MPESEERISVIFACRRFPRTTVAVPIDGSNLYDLPSLELAKKRASLLGSKCRVVGQCDPECELGRLAGAVITNLDST